jgi:hypothetical protein
MIMYDELERMEDETVLAYFKVLRWHLFGRSEESHEKYHLG